MANSSRSDKPVPLLLLPEKIPQKLRDIPQWVTWKYQWRKNNWTKPPYCPRSGNSAKTTDPETWSDYGTALARFKAGGCDGIGIVLTEALGIVGLDLDKCRDAESGVIQPWAQEIIMEIDSYTE